MRSQEPSRDVQPDSTTPGRISNTAFMLGTMVLLLALLLNHYRTITAPYAIDYYESAMPAITQALSQGINPYTRSQLPASTNTYTPLYNIIAMPLTSAFGNTLQVHRALSGAFILGTCLLVFLAVYRTCHLKLTALGASVSLYGVLLYYTTPIASTNSTGLFFFVACVLVPWYYKFSLGSLIASLFLGILAFYGKQYFVLSLGLVAMYLFLARSKRAGILYGLAAVLLLAASLLMVSLTSPYFIDTTVILLHNSGKKYSSDSLLLEQLLFYLEIYWPLILLVVLGLVYRRFVRKEVVRTGRSGWDFDLGDCNRPLLGGNTNYFLVCFIGTTAAVMLVLGKNIGNYMSYHFQLMSPFLVLYVFSVLPSLRIPGPVLVSLLLLNFYLVYRILPQDFDVDARPWEKIESYIAENDRILASPVITSMLIDQDKALAHRTMAFFFYDAKERPKMLVRDNEQDRIEYIYAEYMDDLHHKIESQYFDILILSSVDVYYFFTEYPNPDGVMGGKYLAKHYKRVQTVPLYLTDRFGGGERVMYVWKPRRKEAESAQ